MISIGKYQLLVLFLLVCFVPARASDGTSLEGTIVIKDSRQRDAYELVVGPGDKKPRPGIYGFQDKETLSKPLVWGQVLGATTRDPGTFHILNPESDKADQTLMAVVDGRLLLLNSFSSPQAFKARLVLGQISSDKSQAFPVRDPVSLQHVLLAPILDEAHLSIITLPRESQGHVVLVSVKQDTGIAGATGLTFAFMTNFDTPEDKVLKEFNISEPVLLSYSFLKRAELERFFSVPFKPNSLYQEEHFIAPVVIRALLKKWSREESNPLIDQWRLSLSAFLNFYEPGSAQSAHELTQTMKSLVARKDLPTAKFSITLPGVDLKSGKMISSPSTMELPDFSQFFEPMADGYSFSSTSGTQNSSGNSNKQRGRILWDSKKGQFLSRTISFSYSNALQSSLVAKEDGVMLRVAEGGREDALLDLSSFFEEYDLDPFDMKNAFAYRRLSVPLDFKNDNGADLRLRGEAVEAYHLVFFSGTTRKKKQSTFVLRLPERQGRIRYDKSFGYMQLAMSKFGGLELELRIQPDTDHGYVFDHSTKAMGVNPYDRLLKMGQDSPIFVGARSAVLADQASARFVYLKERISVRMLEDVVYRQFGKEGEKNDRTGFYWERAFRGKAEFLTPGHLIYTAKKKPGNGDEFATKSVFHTQEITVGDHLLAQSESNKTRIALSAFLPLTAKDPINAKVFSMLAMVQTGDEFQGFTSVEIPFPFATIEGVQVFQGMRTKKNSLYIMFFVKKTPDSLGGVYIVGFTSSLDRNGSGRWPVKLQLKPESNGWLMKTSEKMSAIPKRVAIDTEGGLYWVEDPDRLVHDRGYRVRPFESPKKTVNPGEDNSFELNPRETISLEGADGGRLSWFGSKWELSTLGDYRALSPELANAVGFDKDKSASEMVKLERDKAKMAPLYPELDAFLSKEMVASQNRGVKRFLVVSEEDYKRLYTLILAKAALGVGPWHSAAYGAPLRLYHFHGKAGIREMRREISAAAAESGVNVLFAGSDELLEASRLDASTESPEPSSLLDIEEHYVRSKDLDSPSIDPSKAEKGKSPDGSSTDKEEEDQVQDEEGEAEDEVEEGYGPEDGDTASLSEEPELNSKYKKDATGKFKPSGLFLIATEGVGQREEDLLSGHYASLSALVLTTPRKLEALRLAHPHEFRSGLTEKHFVLDYRFLNSPWLTWSPGTNKASKEVRSMSLGALTSEDLNVFPNLRELIAQLAISNEKPGRTILVVPKNLKTLILKYVRMHWASRFGVVTKSRKGGFWNYRNPDLRLFEFPTSERPPQDVVFENLTAMRFLAQSRKKSVVLLADASDIVRSGRPVPSENSFFPAFKITDPAAVRKSELLASAEPSSDVSELKTSRVFPHVLWWLASEGRRVQPKLSKNWRLQTEVPPTFSQLIVATPEEIEDLKKDLGLEHAFMSFDVGQDENFSMIHLNYPELSHRAQILQALFSKEAIRALEYQFSFKGNVGSVDTNPRDGVFGKLTEFMASRIEQVARSLGHEPIESFIRSYTIFRRALVEDPALRRKKMIDENFIDRFLSRVFPIPLNLKTLEADDVLWKIRDVNKASVELVRAGHTGQLDLKQRVLSLILAQTQGSDSSKQIPASAVFYGPTSLGKTFLFDTIVKYLGLKLYDPTHPDDPAAQAFKLIVEDLAESEEKSSGKDMPVEEALRHLDHFLSLPLGYRGFVLIDDLHKAKSQKVLSAVMQYIQNLLNNSMVKVRNLGSKMAIEIPVRNIVLIVTINPASSRKVREDFVDESGSLESRIVAALSQVSGAAYETSVLSRFGGLFDFGDFPREAKASGLIARIRKRSSEALTLEQRLVLVNPEILSLFADLFPNAHARNFLHPVTNELFASVRSDLPQAVFYYVTSKNEAALASHWPYRFGKGSKGAAELSAQIDDAVLRQKIRETVVVKPVQADSVRSRLEFMEYNLNAFRVYLFNALVEAAQEHPSMSSSFNRRVDFLMPFLSASLHTLQQREQLPYWEMNPNATRMEIQESPALTSELEDLVREKRSQKNAILPLNLSPVASSFTESLDSFIPGASPVIQKLGQRDVLLDTVESMRKRMQKLQYRFFRSSKFTEHSAEEWFQEMKARPSSKDDFREFSQFIIEEYMRFISIDGLMNLTLREVASGQASAITPYDMSMLFFICLDKAMLMLSWDSGNAFLMRMLAEITLDPSFSSRAEFTQLAFEAEDSPLNPVSTEFLKQFLSNNDLISVQKNLSQEPVKFQDRCEYLLRGGVNDSGDNPQ